MNVDPSLDRFQEYLRGLVEGLWINSLFMENDISYIRSLFEETVNDRNEATVKQEL